MPLVSFFRSSKRSNKENVPQTKTAPNIIEPQHYTIPNPYSVMTQPKKHKGPQSCPGAPMDNIRSRNPDQPFSDRHSQLNSSARYENLPRRRVDSFDGGQFRRYPIHAQRPIQEERNYYDHRYQYESCDSDEDDYRGTVDDLHSQVAELTRAEKYMREKCKDYKRKMEKAYDELSYYKRDLERQSHAYEKLRKSMEAKLENERKQRAKAEFKNRELAETLQMSMHRIMDLEEKLTFEEKMAEKTTIDEGMGAAGAGEALCDQNDGYSREMINSDTPSVSMFGGSIDQDKDEVRIFQCQDSDEDFDDDNIGTPDIEVQRSLRASPIELTTAASTLLLGTRVGRSFSDTDLQSVANSVKKHTPKTATLERAPSLKPSNGRHHLFVKHSIRESPVFSSSTDDDDLFQQQQYEKQLKRRGDAVKYKPPRKPIEKKYFRRYGQPERAAIEEYKFLEDFSSDASGLLSSPDVGVHFVSRHQS